MASRVVLQVRSEWHATEASSEIPRGVAIPLTFW